MNENKQPTVSIVMATYNRAYLLSDTIDAILKQAYRDFELLIIDDGSSDNTKDLISCFEQIDERIHYFSLKKNKGVGFARNFGISKAKGRFIAIVDSDDHWLPNKLSEQIRIMEKYPNIDFLFSDYSSIAMYDDGKATRGFELTEDGLVYVKKESLEKTWWSITEGFEQGILVSNFVATSTILFRLKIISLTKGYIDSIKIGEDIDFCLRAALSGAKFAYSDQILQTRRVYADSATQSDLIEKAYSQLHGTKLLREACLSAGRVDLLYFVQRREQHIWQKLLLVHAKNNHRGNTIATYAKSLRYGFSIKTLLIFGVGLVGSQLINRLRWR